MFCETEMSIKLERDIPHDSVSRETLQEIVSSQHNGRSGWTVYCQSQDWVVSVSLTLSWLKSVFLAGAWFRFARNRLGVVQFLWCFQLPWIESTSFWTTLASSNESTQSIIKNCGCFFAFLDCGLHCTNRSCGQVCSTPDPQTSSTRFVFDLQTSGKTSFCRSHRFLQISGTQNLDHPALVWSVGDRCWSWLSVRKVSETSSINRQLWKGKGLSLWNFQVPSFTQDGWDCEVSKLFSWKSLGCHIANATPKWHEMTRNHTYYK